MSATMTIDRALTDQRLLGAGLDGDLVSWATWLVVLKGAFGLQLSDDELRRSTRSQVIVRRPLSVCANCGR